MTKGLLKGNGGNIREPAIFCLFFEFRQQCGQILVVEAYSVLVVGIGLFAQRPIVDESGTSECLCKNILLFVSGVKPVLICSLLFHELYDSGCSVTCQRYTQPKPQTRNAPHIPIDESSGFTGRLINISPIK